MVNYERVFYIVNDDSKPVTVDKPAPAAYTAFSSNSIELRAFYVGSGEAILVSRGRLGMMVDCGEGSSKIRNDELGKRVSQLLTNEGIRLDAIVASHPHQDHLNAFPYVLQHSNTTAQEIQFYFNGDAEDRAIENIVDTHKVEPVSVKPKKSVTLLGAAKGKFLVGEETPSNRKIASDFLFFSYRKATFLFTGDVRACYENAMIPSLHKLHNVAHVLKVTHHGSSSGTSADFVLALQPRISVSSSDKPADHRLEDDVRTRLESTGVVYPTYDLQRSPPQRDVTIRTDGRLRTHQDHQGIMFELVTTSPALKK